MSMFTSAQKTMLFVLISIIFSCSTMEIKSDLSSLQSSPHNELQALIQLKKTKIQTQKMEKTNSHSQKQSAPHSFKKIADSQAFEKACSSARVEGNRYLKATCAGRTQTLDLNPCLYAENGVLIYEEDGEFYDSCSKCQLNRPRWAGKKQPMNFECKCYDDDLREIKTNINLQDFVYFDGKLRCANLDPRKLPAAKAIDTECKSISITEDKALNTSCKISAGKFSNKKFHAQDCMQNNNGHFDAGSHFGRSCHLCEVAKENGVYVITCDCEDARQSRRREYAALNEFYDVKKSEIICHDPSKKAEKKEFNFDIKPAKKQDGITIDPKKPKVEEKKITIPAKKTTITKIDEDTTHIHAKNSTINTVVIPIDEVKKKEFEINVTPAKKEKGITIDPKKEVIKDEEITIPATKKTINKEISETTHIDMKNATINTVTIPIEKAEEVEEEDDNKDSGAIIDYDVDLSGSDNFFRNCHNFSYGDHILGATCGSNNKELTLDLNHCIANIDGKLKFGKDGNYGNTCKECEIKTNGYGVYFLNCKCKGMEMEKKKNLKTHLAILETKFRDTFVSLQEKIIILKESKKLSCLPELILENEKEVVKCESRSFLKSDKDIKK